MSLTDSAVIRPSTPTGNGVTIGGRFTTTGALGIEPADPTAKDHPIEFKCWTPARP